MATTLTGEQLEEVKQQALTTSGLMRGRRATCPTTRV